MEVLHSSLYLGVPPFFTLYTNYIAVVCSAEEERDLEFLKLRVNSAMGDFIAVADEANGGVV